MSENITQWLTEIRTLQRQLADAQKERDQALASAANWRRLYETEAEQRRLAVDPSSPNSGPEPEPPAASSPTGQATDISRQEAIAFTPVPELQAKLQELIQLNHRLREQLTAEQAAHVQTRQTLTTALGDAFDSFKAGDRPVGTPNP